MSNCKANKCIKCSVSDCANHCKTSDYCALDTVSIGTHESYPTEKKCVDCESFILDSKADFNQTK